MPKPNFIADDIAISPALSGDAYAEVARAGFKAVIALLPDSEAQSPAHAARVQAEAAGLAFAHVPVAKYEVFTDEALDAVAAAFAALPRPILATCASGQRAAIVWAGTAARAGAPVSSVLSSLSDAGFDFGFLRDDLEQQADRRRWATARASSRAAA